MQNQQVESTTSKQAPPSSGIYYEHNVPESSEHQAIVARFKQIGIGKKFLADAKLAKETGKPVEAPEPEVPEHINTKFVATEYRHDGKKVFVVSPKEGKTKKVVLNLHGGGYLYGIFPWHWDLVEKFVGEYKCTVIMPDYPLSPNSFVDSFKFIEPIYKKLIKENDPSDVILSGESAGAGFALGLAMKLKQENIPQPSHILLLSPWLDVACTNPQMAELEHHEPVLTLEFLKQAGSLYTQGQDITDYRVSPVNGDVEGLGKVSLFVSAHEMMYADSLKLRSKFIEKGVPIDFYAYPHMSHCFPAHHIPESDVVLGQLRHCFL